jgi:hypothetical protein
MDKSKLPGMTKRSFPWFTSKPKKKPKAAPKKRGGVGGVLDAVAERNRRLKEAAGD